MSERVRLAIAGSMNLDMVVRSTRIPSPGENICGADFTMVSGGKGANQAVAAARLGMEPSLLSCVGEDYFGDYLVDRLQAEGVDTSLVRREHGEHTGVALIVVEEGTGRNTIVVDPGANMALTPGDLGPWSETLQQASCALFQLEIPLEVVLEGARMCREAGVRSILDAGPPRRDAGEVIGFFDVVSPNEKELAALTGLEIRSPRDAAKAAKALTCAGAETVVVKLGEWGAVVVGAGGGNAWHLPAFKVKAVDETAAGDSFTTALSLALQEGRGMIEAVLFANAAGAMAVTRLGAQPSMPTRKSVESMLEEHLGDDDIAPVMV